MTASPCPRPHCGGQVVTQHYADSRRRVHTERACLLCGRSPDGLDDAVRQAILDRLREEERGWGDA